MTKQSPQDPKAVSPFEIQLDVDGFASPMGPSFERMSSHLLPQRTVSQIWP